MKRIGVLTSGGDAPGMNAAIRSIVRSAIYHGIEVMGVNRGFRGLIEGDLFMMDVSSVGDIIHKGGTMLKSSRSEEFKTIEGRKKAMENLNNASIEGLVVIGGDGSFQGAREISELGIKTIGIPGTIDNDLAYTDFTIGFDTAVNTVLDSISKIRDTSTSHEKATIIEVMGRNCGDIALHAGISGGAESIVIPEMPLKIEDMIKKLNQGYDRGKLHHIILLAEGAGKAEDMRIELAEKAGIDARVSVLGFIQRGGDPTSFDRILASKMGVHAVEMLLEGYTNMVVGIKDSHLFHMDITESLKVKKRFDKDLYRLTELLSI
ncbi:6-phosphofructokinase [Salipaludibacillus daqingensis]|uniref:6-phosphofructokinase n=1 Tax=Salipaludibacillus daqingensis TaxID=3041001 RepID=UPI0024738767|nr:6-phosphofructokinase [Salipaludibacillus daqingensis]